MYYITMLPKNLKYQSKVESAPAKSYRSNIAPQNGTGNYNLGETITINIPTRSNLVQATTESYLKFNATYMTAAAANVARLDSCGAHGLIQRIRIWHGSNLLQDIDNYGLLAKMLFDIQISTDATYGKYNVLSGTRSDLVVTLPAPAAAPVCAAIGDVVASVAAALAPLGAAATTGQRLSALQVNSGELIADAWAVAAPQTVTYCLNLISLMGSLCSSQYFPSFACTSAPIRMEIQLVDTAFKGIMAVTGLTSIILSNVEYVANFIELSDQAMGLIQQSLQGQPLQFVLPDYRNYGGSYTTTALTASQYNFAIPAKFSSLKSLFVTIRDQGTGALTFYPYSCVMNGLTDYYFRVGSQIMPSKVTSTVPEHFAELLKAIGSISDLNHQPSIDKFTYSLANSVATTVNVGVYKQHSSVSSGSFYIGIDLENYANSVKDSIFAGYNSNTDDIFCVLNFGNTTTGQANRLDAFALFDEILIFENSTCFTRY